ncbi:MAG: response regulator [Gemmataceae bacterium]|nr:response regulator [Gemmataceae bacterium]
MKALVIDDSRAMRVILGGMLKQLGFEVADAENGRVGLDRLRSMEQIDIVLVDWNMPEMNGYEFLVNMRAERKYDEVRIMMVTTETEMSQMQKALSSGANEYVMKPFTREVIQEKLEMLGVVVHQAA